MNRFELISRSYKSHKPPLVQVFVKREWLSYTPGDTNNIEVGRSTLICWLDL